MKSFSLDESTQQVFVGRKGPTTGLPSGQPSGSALALAAATMAGCSVAAAGGSTAIHPGHSSASTSLTHNYASHVNPCMLMRRRRSSFTFNSLLLLSRDSRNLPSLVRVEVSLCLALFRLRARFPCVPSSDIFYLP